MSRFAPLSEPQEGSRFANLAERLNAPLPGEPLYREGNFDAPLGGKSKRLEAFRERTAGTSTVALPKASTAPKPTVAPPATPTRAEAIQAASEAARARVATVMASAPAKGRERQAHELLMASCEAKAEHRTSPAIIAQLAKLPFDNQLAAVDKHLREWFAFEKGASKTVRRQII